MRNTRAFDSETIVKSVKSYYKHNSYRKASRDVGVSKSSIWRWVTSLGNAIRNRAKPGRRYKKQRRRKKTVITTCKPYVVDIVNRNPMITIGELQHILDTKYNVVVSQTTLRRCLKSAQYSYKSAWQRTIRTNLEDRVTEFMKQFTATSGIDDLICIDETSFDTRAHPRKGWALRKCRLHFQKQATNVVRSRCTVIAAITTSGLVASATLSSGLKVDTFIEFVNTLKHVPQRYILLDNLSAHKSPRALEAIRLAGKVPLFIPPYSPQYNPIEQFFAFLKHHHRQQNISMQYVSPEDFRQHVDAFVFSCSLGCRSVRAFFNELQMLTNVS
jgi:transposase